MKILKVLGMALLVLIVGYVILCVFGPKTMDTERSITINAPTESVFGVVSDFGQWNEWSPWYKRETTMKTTVTGNPGTVGHKLAWVSETQGSGEMEVTGIEPGTKMTSALRFKDWDSESTTEFIVTPEGNGSKMTWTMKGDETPFMFRGLMLLMGGQEMMNNDFDEGLNSLKKMLE
ncbi:MAG: SRPBCC family protein [Flavobacteriales bacterium]